MSITIGSLFDGSGGFPLAGALCGFRSVWASEVEPYPIAVTKSRLPNMRHLGDISKINGANIEPVDIITFGSPCQGLSVAGRQKGLNDERSALFMEAIRIIKEMREATNGEYPKWAIWENVPGAFSSNAGQDFRAVLEELIKIAEPNAVMPEVPKKGWAYADSYVGNGWSLAYRVLDSQYLRTAQRRRRVYLGLCLTDERAARKVLFERESLRGHFAESRTPRQGVAAEVEGSVGADDRERAVCYGISSYDSNAMKSSNPNSGIYEADTSRTLDLNGGNPACNQGGVAIVEPTFILDNLWGQAEYGKESRVNGTLRAGAQGAVAYSVENHPADSRVNLDNSGKVQTLTSRMGTGGGNVPMVMEPFCKAHRAQSVDDATTWKHAEVANTLNTFDQGEARANELIVALEGNGQRPSHHGDGYAKTDKSYTLNATEVHGVVYAVDQGAGKSSASVTEDLSPTLTCANDGAPAIAIDRAFFNQGQNALYEPQTYEDGTNPTLVAKGPSAVCLETFHLTTEDDKTQTLKARDYKDPLTVVFGEKPRYIVRRLTPTECARLQGFPDRWGDIEPKAEFTDEEYRFWLEARNTHAAINGRRTKEYTKKQMLAWHNKLHTDSAEYKMWGNGIALPCALYVMQGIKEALCNQ